MRAAGTRPTRNTLASSITSANRSRWNGCSRRSPEYSGGRPSRRARAPTAGTSLAGIRLQLRQSHKLLIARAPLDTVDPGLFKGFTRRKPASTPTPFGPRVPRPQAIATGESVGFQFAGNTVAPSRGDLVHGRLAAAGRVAQDRIGRHRHGYAVRNRRDRALLRRGWTRGRSWRPFVPLLSCSRPTPRGNNAGRSRRRL